MRIIAGTARSRTIEAPEGLDTRPTLDRVKESLFNILQGQLQDSSVLDLFAGSGALGLEALSRGASHAVFADVSPQTAKIIQNNVDRLGFSKRAQVLRSDWCAAVSTLAIGKNHAFDLVFLDPPYRMTNTDEICLHMLHSGILSPGALIVIEHAFETPPRLSEDFIVTDSRRYRETGITFCTLAGGKEGA